LFTRDFRKLRAVGSATLALLVVYVGVNVALLGLTRAVEVRYGSYPWQNEDWLRVLLPTLWRGHGQNRILIAGPSEAREDLLYELFDKSFPGQRAFQGGQSQGTFEGLMLTLEYVERVYGRSAVPHTLVLGVTPRFVANIPRGRSPLVGAIDRYSPHFRVQNRPDGLLLADKGLLDSLQAMTQFLLFKQPNRYLSAVASVVRRALPEDRRSAWVARWLQIYGSPYKFHRLPRVPEEGVRAWMSRPTSFWYAVHQWEPDADAFVIRRQFARLLAFTREHSVRLYVVNLPESVWNREGYRPGCYERYEALVRESLGDTPFLDLRTMLGPDEFYDAGHATLPGALRVSRRVIDFVRTQVGVAQR
jgi:hypothetical protein